jgi:3-deoxy-7-phosphoheptulonate synthase
MIVCMQSEASSGDIEYVIKRAASVGLKTHVSDQGGRKVIHLLGNTESLVPQAISGLRGVDDVRLPSQSHRLASRDFQNEPTVVKVLGLEIGGPRVVTMAGPCSVESAEQISASAAAVKRAGATVLRGGAFKPRSSPYSFQGLGEEGLQILASARERTGLAIITEVLEPEKVELVARYADILQLGTRNMQNYALLHAVGESGKPVLLKRGMMSTIKELLLCAEYIMSHGNPNVLLCERGIRTFETYTRNTLDINAVPALKELTHLPVIVDPSHATGKASLVKAVAKAAVAAGADGLLIEVHPDPDSAWSDGYQSLDFEQFEELTAEVRSVAEAVGREF